MNRNWKCLKHFSIWINNINIQKNNLCATTIFLFKPYINFDKTYRNNKNIYNYFIRIFFIKNNSLQNISNLKEDLKKD